MSLSERLVIHSIYCMHTIFNINFDRCLYRESPSPVWDTSREWWSPSCSGCRRGKWSRSAWRPESRTILLPSSSSRSLSRPQPGKFPPVSHPKYLSVVSFSFIYKSDERERSLYYMGDLSVLIFKHCSPFGGIKAMIRFRCLSICVFFCSCYVFFQFLFFLQFMCMYIV